MSTHLYRHFDTSGRLLYVGISLSAINRLAQHKDYSHWFSQISRVEIETFQSRQEALEHETKAIQQENPAYNIRKKNLKETRDVYAFEASRTSAADLTHRVVKFNAIYDLRDLAEVLGVNSRTVKKLIENGDMGSITLPAREGLSGHGTPYKPKQAVTGWQLIEYLEHLQGREIR